MGLSLSLLSSAWEVILKHGFLDLPYDHENLENRLPSESESEYEITSQDSSPTKRRNTISLSSSSSEPLKIMLQTTLSFKNLVQEIGNRKPDNPNLETGHSGPANHLPEPVVFVSPRPVSELNAAATTVQKIYKSYRTRRNLADCAVVVEELWWKALDFAALDRSSVSFFNVEKHETAVSRWARARTRAAKVGKGLSKNEKAQKLALQHWLEAIDPRHRYGHNLHMYYDIWFLSESCQPFFYWLDVGDGKEVNVEKCPRPTLQRQCIKYLGPNERESYEVIVENGKLVFRQSGLLLETTEGSKWIFVLSTTSNLYNFREFICFLEENHVDLTNVKRCSVDDDDVTVGFSFKPPQSELKPKPLVIPRPRAVDILRTPTRGDRASLNHLANRLSCKWTSGTGPRIGCVRDYPAELQSRALEQVNLSPRVGPTNFANYGPVPSPRPSPKVRLSPRLSYMGLPSPRTPVATTS
ncbi:putative IQ domain-containing protein IQM [Helianthus annuus]|nr:putative IQ domain-containing protein IQM [Helianthus annuus]